jgi:hypothetical protein
MLEIQVSSGPDSELLDSKESGLLACFSHQDSCFSLPPFFLDYKVLIAAMTFTVGECRICFYIDVFT